jgi:putative redox protein
MANKMKIQLRQISASTSEATIGRHQVLIDRPAVKGGSDAGPMGGELFLAAVGGCFMSNLLAAILARAADISDVRVEVVGDLAESPARFAGIDLRVSAERASRELLERLIEIADRGCIMMNTLRGNLEVRVLVASPV